MFHNNSFWSRTFIRHLLPDGINIRSVKIARPIPSPAPHYIQHESATTTRWRACLLTMLGTRLKFYRPTLFFHEQPIMWTKPHPVLRIRTRIIGKTTQTDIPSYSGQIFPRGMYDIEYLLYDASASEQGNFFGTKDKLTLS